MTDDLNSYFILITYRFLQNIPKIIIGLRFWLLILITLGTFDGYQIRKDFGVIFEIKKYDSIILQGITPKK